MALRFDGAPAKPEETKHTVGNATCEKKMQMLEREVLRFCESKQEGLISGQYDWLTHVRDVNATQMARNIMHALRWGKRDASHGLLFTKRAFTTMDPPCFCGAVLQAGGNDGVQTPFDSMLEKIRQEEADEGLLQGCEWPQQEPIWQAASDAVVWRNGDALVRSW
ncbi:lia1 [Symbiodinium sp. CCMP2592]|nr:lia1 [Symbiodinium sp. CCMP2592]